MAAKRRQGRSICMRQARFVPPAVNPAYLLPNAPRHSRSACSPVLRASHSAEYKSQCGVRRPLPCVPPSKPHSPLARVLRPASPHFRTPYQQTALPARTCTVPCLAPLPNTLPANRTPRSHVYCAPSRRGRHPSRRESHPSHRLLRPLPSPTPHRPASKVCRCVGALVCEGVCASVHRCVGDPCCGERLASCCVLHPLLPRLSSLLQAAILWQWIVRPHGGTMVRNDH